MLNKDNSIQTIIDYYNSFRLRTIDIKWQIGRVLSQMSRGSKQRAEYGNQTLRAVSERLTSELGPGFSVNNLELMRKFYLTYKKKQINPALEWSHYRELVKIKDPHQRKQLEDRADKESLSRRAFTEIIVSTKKARPHKETVQNERSRLTLVRGSVDHYRISKSQKNGALLIDCGFKILYPIKAREMNLPGEIVQTIKKGNDYRIRKVDSHKKELYTYRAELERVVDGDTLILIIDLGFNIKTRQRVRLKGINTPELSTNAGKRAKVRVSEILKESRQLIVKTYGYGKFARALADIFHLPGESDPSVIQKKGKLLNQQLLDEGHAELY